MSDDKPIPPAIQRLFEAEDRIANLDKRLREAEAFIAVLRAAVGGVSSNGVGAIATGTDLDGKYGNPKVRCNPMDWGGTPRKGHLLNRCEPEFLDLYAAMLESFAQKADAAGEKASNGKPKSFYDRADAARARGWAKRLREGWAPPQQKAPARPPAASGGRGWGAGAQAPSAPPAAMPPQAVDDPYAPRGEEPLAEEYEDDSIPF